MKQKANYLIIISVIVFLVTGGFLWAGGGQETDQEKVGSGSNGGINGSAPSSSVDKNYEGLKPPEALVQNLDGYSVATFAGGCFWCMEPPFEKLVGVAEVISGYTGGKKENPTYQEVSSGVTKHVEAVQVYYSPKVVSYEQLLQVYWRQIDPTDEGGSFVDRGYQYTTAVFYADRDEGEAAEESQKELEESGRFDGEIATRFEKAGPFYKAEEYHQDFYLKDPDRYYGYRSGSGRDQFVDRVWGDEKHVEGLVTKEERYESFDKEQRILKLDEIEYKVTQEEGTEMPFQNRYWDNKEEGLYVDIVSGEPLFSSRDKYKSGTGWPSFTRPVEPDNIVYKEDTKMSAPRVEVRSKYADSHLGHVFKDGPEPTGLRYCMNSASMRFIPVEDLEKEGYEQFRVIFE